MGCLKINKQTTESQLKIAHKASREDKCEQGWYSVDPPMLDGRYLDGQINSGVFNPSNLSIYAYTWQNPIKLTDPNGEAPGDPFKSKIEALNDFAEYYNGASIVQEREFGSWVYYNPKKDEYSYTIANRGEKAHVIPNNDIPEDSSAVTDVHTHSNYDPEYASHKFSTRDKEGYNHYNHDGYVVTPGGKLLEYNVETGKTNDNLEGASKDIPSDPDTPKYLRENKINAVDKKPIFRDQKTGKIHNQNTNKE